MLTALQATTQLHCTALHCTAISCKELNYPALHCTLLHFTTLHFTTLHLSTLQTPCPSSSTTEVTTGEHLAAKLPGHALIVEDGTYNIHQIGPLGRFGLVVAMSVDMFIYIKSLIKLQIQYVLCDV